MYLTIIVLATVSQVRYDNYYQTLTLESIYHVSIGIINFYKNNYNIFGPTALLHTASGTEIRKI